jgi:histidyl-tRNA synthetase
VQLLVNTLGDVESRDAYTQRLRGFLADRAARMSPASRQRIERGSLLRVLDSKDPADRELLADAPRIVDALTPAARGHYNGVLRALTTLGVAYRETPSLVRGLDYYSHTVFEFEATGLGAQATVLAGGRYDGLLPLLGGPALGAVGWAAGIERLVLVADAARIPPLPPRVAVVRVQDAPGAGAVHDSALLAARALRDAGLVCVSLPAGKLGKQLQAVRAALGADRVV